MSLSELSTEEIQRRLANNEYIGYAEKSVLDTSPTTFKDAVLNTLESVAKGSSKGILDLVGGWESLYNYLDAGKNAEAAKPTRILNAVKQITGINLESAPYTTPYNIAAAGAPAAAVTALGVPGLFRGGPISGPAKEFAVAGTVGAAAPLLTESPFGQLAIQATPYAAKGGFTTAQNIAMRPQGTFPSISDTQSLLNVGPLTPGQLTLNRQQLATEARVAASPRAEEAPGFFRTQAESVQKYLDDLFTRSAQKTLNPEDLTKSVVTSFQNYGKALSTRLRSDANKDFKAAKGAGGLVDTQPVLDVVQTRLQAIPPETPGFEGLRSALGRISDEFTIPEIPASVTPSTILGPTGQPVDVKVTPGTPAQAQKIDIDRLQKNLSAWGEAAYSGKADFGKGNIFEGVAPGQAKAISLDVLRGYKQALDNAIQNGVPGADKLVKARDNFAANIQRIEEFANRPLVKAFDVERATDLVPEQVLTKLKNAPESQRAILVNVLQNNPDASVILDTIRRSTFDDILNKAQAPGAAATAPEFNIDVALKELNKKESDFNFLFQSKQDLNDAKLVLNYMRRAVQSETGGAAMGMAGSTAYATTKALGGNTQLANATKELTDIIRDKITNSADFSSILFNPDSRDALLKLAKGRTTLGFVQDAARIVGKTVGISAVRAGPMLSIEQAPDEAINATQPTGLENMTTEQIQQMLQQME
jgi:hypothetical protein